MREVDGGSTTLLMLTAGVADGRLGFGDRGFRSGLWLREMVVIPSVPVRLEILALRQRVRVGGELCIYKWELVLLREVRGLDWRSFGV